MAADWAVRAVRLRRRKSPSHRAWLAGGPCGRACLQFQEAARAWGASFAFCTSTKTSPLQSRVRAYLGLPIKRHPEVRSPFRRSASSPQWKGRPARVNGRCAVCACLLGRLQVVVVTHIDSARQLTKFLCPSTESAEAIRLCFGERRRPRLSRARSATSEREPATLHCLLLSGGLAERFEKNLLAPFFKSAEPPELQKGAVYVRLAGPDRRCSKPLSAGNNPNDERR